MLKDEEKKRQREEQIKKMQEKIHIREQSKDESMQKIKAVINSKPLYKVYEEKYKQEVEMPYLEEKKKQLEDLRNFHKPL